MLVIDQAREYAFPAIGSTIDSSFLAVQSFLEIYLSGPVSIGRSPGREVIEASVK